MESNKKSSKERKVQVTSSSPTAPSRSKPKNKNWPDLMEYNVYWVAAYVQYRLAHQADSTSDRKKLKKIYDDIRKETMRRIEKRMKGLDKQDPRFNVTLLAIKQFLNEHMLGLMTG